MIAKEVIAGRWERRGSKKRLKTAGYDYDSSGEGDAIVKFSQKNWIDVIARGHSKDWGNGDDRKNRLKAGV
ncbi:MAG: hypothetical protein ACLTDF_06515 [Coprococcus sp.]